MIRTCFSENKLFKIDSIIGLPQNRYLKSCNPWVINIYIAVYCRWDEFLRKPCLSLAYKCPLIGLIKFLPEVYMAVLNRCHTVSNDDVTSKSHWVLLLLKILRSSMHPQQFFRRSSIFAICKCAGKSSSK